ncbi:hypothetical protein [Thauera sp. SDU_THAU2]|uniref:hypothetical protein n=1 Tax=Thauera sp. SDU_THAU2 TaxID=3136633 RepID=UPI00311F41C3
MARHWLIHTGLTLAAVLCAACTSLSVPRVPGNPLLATLPFQAAGIEDGREAFAARFSRELEADGYPANPSNWLHHVDETAGKALPVEAMSGGLSVLIVPGIFSDCVDEQSLPFSDGIERERPANYTEGYAHYRASLGSVRAIQLSGRASSASNAVLIADEVQAEARRAGVEAIVLVAYSKGLPDALLALDVLRGEGRLPAELKALVSISGVLLGTPIADRYQRLHDSLAPLFAPLGCSPSAGGEVASLTVRERLPWLVARRLPERIALYSVVAHAERDAVSPGLRHFHDLLATLDPMNDGQVIAGWSLLPGSTLLAEVKSDHWTYVLPLSGHPSLLVRTIASPADFPRAAFFRAVVKSVAQDLQR